MELLSTDTGSLRGLGSWKVSGRSLSGVNTIYLVLSRQRRTSNNGFSSLYFSSETRRKSQERCFAGFASASEILRYKVPREYQASWRRLRKPSLSRAKQLRPEGLFNRFSPSRLVIRNSTSRINLESTMYSVSIILLLF